jgi:hypothetical protein
MATTSSTMRATMTNMAAAVAKHSVHQVPTASSGDLLGDLHAIWHRSSLRKLEGSPRSTSTAYRLW